MQTAGPVGCKRLVRCDAISWSGGCNFPAGQESSTILGTVTCAGPTEKGNSGGGHRYLDVEGATLAMECSTHGYAAPRSLF